MEERGCGRRALPAKGAEVVKVAVHGDLLAYDAVVPFDVLLDHVRRCAGFDKEGSSRRSAPSRMPYHKRLDRGPPRVFALDAGYTAQPPPCQDGRTHHYTICCIAAAVVVRKDC
jgi:hypothetical protein